MLLGAALNVALVRGACARHGAAASPPSRLVSRYRERGAALLSGALREAIEAQPVAMVALLRLPFLGNGALNYVLSLHTGLPVTSMMAGNALGMVLGSVLFPLAGSQLRSLGSMIAQGPGEGAARDAALGWFFGILGVVMLALGGAALVVRRVTRRIVAEQGAQRAGAAADAVAALVIVRKTSDCELCSVALRLRVVRALSAPTPLPPPLSAEELDALAASYRRGD